MDKLLPKNINDSDLGYFDQKLSLAIPAHKIKEIGDVFFNSDNLVFKDGKILSCSFVNGTLDYFTQSKIKILTIINRYVGIKKFVKDLFLLTSRFLKKKIIVTEPCLCFTDTWSIGYFHWFLDALPRLLTAENFLKEATVVLPASYKRRDYIVASLKIFPINNIRWVENNEVLSINRLIVPNHIGPSGNYDQKITTALIKKLKDRYHNNKRMDLGDKIYISRGKAGRRHITNEEELLPLLARHDFKTVYLEDYSWEDQVSICQNAKYLISNHGAGLTNLIFMNPGSKVMELGGAQNQFYHYFALAQQAQITYYYQICRYVPSLFKKTNNKKDLIVDPLELEKNINLMIGDNL
jgi:hypothetical protein